MPGHGAEDCWIEAPARSFWQLEEGLPTSTSQPVDTARDLNRPRRVNELTLDDVLTELTEHAPPSADGLLCRGQLLVGPEAAKVVGRLQVFASPAFRELVAFTPPHRKAVCLEPYTCVTDAINLRDRVDSGLLVLEPGQEWSAVVELAWR
jgi:aldose 1-epimerase